MGYWIYLDILDHWDDVPITYMFWFLGMFCFTDGILCLGSFQNYAESKDPFWGTVCVFPSWNGNMDDSWIMLKVVNVI